MTTTPAPYVLQDHTEVAWLPVRSVVLDDREVAWQKDDYGDWKSHQGAYQSSRLASYSETLTVLYAPEQAL